MIRSFLLLLIRFYQSAVSPHLGQWCRFDPSCSEYARQALMVHGVAQGSWLALRRLSCCHPFCAGGHDPVPGANNGTEGVMNHAPAIPSISVCRTLPLTSVSRRVPSSSVSRRGAIHRAQPFSHG